MAQKTEGIQQLLIAEKKATEKVVDARKRKAIKLKTAKKEADSEINKFKGEKELHFKKLEQEMLGKKSDNEAHIQLQTNQKIKEIDVMLKNNKGPATKAILEALFDITVELHINVKL
uniref:V-type proton ATPase subunit G n=1 Tax=Arion vulgaris TaxID=1028688 RepID=A0A0B6YRQ5_9EUPU